MKKDTWIAFVDFKKAFDRVPHEGLFAKCWKIGVRGTALHFIKQLYALSSAKVRSGAHVSESFPVRRGVRQGCPLSPILFLIFINDLYLDKDRHLGVSVPTCYGQMARRCPGLLFADDDVTVAEDPAHLQRALKALDKWAKQNAMIFGIRKCGIMTVRGRTQTATPPRIFRLGKSPVPNVAEYKYLGILISSDLSMTPHVERRANKGTLALNALRPVLGDWSVPLQIRRMLVTSILVPILTYGLELSGIGPRGGCHTMALPLERCLAAALRSMLRCGPHATSYDTLLKEFDLQPIEDIGHVRRMRLFLKYSSLRKTWISYMLRRIESSRAKRSWINATKDLMAKYEMELDGVQQITPCVQKRLLARMDDERGSKRARLVAKSFQNHSTFVVAPCWNRPMRSPEARLGLNVLRKMRCGAFYSCYRQSHWLGEQLATECPFCFDAVPETIHHLLVECPAWERERAVSGVDDLLERLSLMRADHEQSTCDMISTDFVGIGSQQPLMGVQLLGGQLLGLLMDRDNSSPEDGSENYFESVCNFLGLIYRKRLNKLIEMRRTL